MFYITGSILANKSLPLYGDRFIPIQERENVNEPRSTWQGVKNWFDNLKNKKEACIEVRDEKGNIVASKDEGFSNLIFGKHFYQETTFLYED